MRTRARTALAAVALAGAAGLAAGCGSASSSTPRPAPSPAFTTIAPAPPFAAEGLVCAGLNALLNPLTGTSTKAQAWHTVEQAYSITPAQVARATHDKCPAYS